jgi:hypothetical protein
VSAAAHSNFLTLEDSMPALALRMQPMDLQPSAPALRLMAIDFNSAWGVTMPAYLDTTPQATPFREAIRGLVTREVHEPDLFEHFFG